MNTFNSPWAKLTLTLTVALMFSATLAYQHITDEIKTSAKQSVQNIDDSIKEIVTEIRQLPYDESCPESLMHGYANLAYENERIRAVGYIRESEEGTFVCSMLGKTSLHQKYWRGALGGDVFIGWSLLTDYFPETSFVVGVDEGDRRFFAYVNPRRLVGHWLEPTLPYANYAFKLESDLQPNYFRAPLEADDKGMSYEVSSSQYSYSVTAFADYHTLVKRSLIYWLRALVAAVIILSTLWLLNQSFRDNRPKPKQSRTSV